MIVVGVDPHKKSHTAVAVDASTGQLVGELSVPARRRGHERLLSWARALDPEVRVALEDCRHVSGALEALLLKSGVAVVRVPPRLMGQARRGQRTRGKSDPIDAAAVARAALAHPDLPVAQMAGPDREIRLLVDHREDLVAERTRIQSRLRWRLHELDPELSIPLRALNRRKWLEAATRRLDELGPSLQARLAGAELERCVALTASIDALERELEARVSAEAPELLALPGCGPLTAAKLVGEIAGVERFATPARLAMNAGVAPLPVSSGARQRHRLNRQGNRQLNCALHWLAVNQGRLHQPAREYLARKESEGHSRREALRAFKRHLVNVVWRLLVSTASDDQLKAGAPAIAPALT